MKQQATVMFSLHFIDGTKLSPIKFLKNQEFRPFLKIVGSYLKQLIKLEKALSYYLLSLTHDETLIKIGICQLIAF